MNEQPRLIAMSTEELGRYLADAALEMANAELKLNAALDELSRRVGILTDLGDTSDARSTPSLEPRLSVCGALLMPTKGKPNAGSHLPPPQA